MASGQPILIPVKIASGAALSGEIDLQGARLVGIIMPSAWTAAAITLQASHDEGETYQEVQALNHLNGAGVAVTFNVVAAIFYVIGNSTITDPSENSVLQALKWVKVRSGTSGVPVNQAADRNFWLVVKW